MLHKNPSQNGLRGIFRILYPKKYPIFSKNPAKKDARRQAQFLEEFPRLVPSLAKELEITARTGLTIRKRQGHFK